MQKTSKSLLSCVAGFAAVMCFGGTDSWAAGRAMTTTARMPTMPVMSINTVGTHAVSGVEVPTGSNNTSGGGVVNPVDPVTPTNCEDGGVANSEFTVDMCMKSILDCIQSGTLPNGLNDLFNEDLRNSIFNGMGVCASELDKCIREVRVDCYNVYNSAQDVWLDFNSRIVQPEYYNFVLRRTGLTPNQAENVCELLDKNTYGKSFAAVSHSENVTSEYNDKIGAYNEQEHGSLSKHQPQGPMVNTTNNGNTGVDGERGHYARWDATNAICKIRVAAYNKDEMITNKWLFGAIGDDKSAEVWQDAGSTFTCNKDLFDFSLMNNTKTAAVVGMGGGTLLGAGIGALAGHGDRAFDCKNESARDEFWAVLKPKMMNGGLSNINLWLDDPISISDELDKDKCDDIIELYSTYLRKKPLVTACREDASATCNFVYNSNPETIQCSDVRTPGYLRVDGNTLYVNGKSYDLSDQSGAAQKFYDDCRKTCICSFKALMKGNTDIYCDGEASGGCQSRAEAANEITALDKLFDSDVKEILEGQKSNRLKTTLVGAGVGLGTGGVATAITAFVERNNISCHVGDGLNIVGFGKSFTIGSLKDYYVKWNLRVADSISPTGRVTSCQDWINTCGMYTTAEDCNNVVINYQAPGRITTTTIRSACRMAGSVCVESIAAVSYGVCPLNASGQNNSGTAQSDVRLIQH